MSALENRLDQLRTRLCQADFLANRGLSNEVGLYIFAYPPQDEMAVRAFVKRLQGEMTGEGSPCRVLAFDLYDILLDVCRERRLLDKIAPMEKQKGRAFIQSQLERLAPPEAYIRHIARTPHAPGDVALITGVGRVYPYMRAHLILNNIQSILNDIPIVMFYPGAYSGQSLTLFEAFPDDHYYRAFNIV